MPDREPEVKTIKASEARQQFSQVLNDVFRKKNRVVVEKSGIPVAAIVSMDDWERFSRAEAEREVRFKALEESWKAFEGVPTEEIEREVARAVAEARAKLRSDPQRQAKAS